MRTHPSDRSAFDTEISQNLMFYVVNSASFVEITSDLYTKNLVAYFEDDPEIAEWLSEIWETQEVGHGDKLKHYAQREWPDFDWDAAYAKFFEEFEPFCTPTELAPSRAQQLAGLCVVETGTSCLYRMLADAATDPELSRVTAGIGREEIGHYKQFLYHFNRYRIRESASVMTVLRAMWHEAAAIQGVDAYYAFKHVYLSRNPGASFDKSDYRRFRRASRGMAMRHFPYRMGVKMLLKLLPLPAFYERLLVPPLASMSRLLLLM